MAKTSPSQMLSPLIVRAAARAEGAHASARRPLSKDLRYCLAHFSLCWELAFQRSVARYRTAFLGALWVPLGFILFVTTLAALWGLLLGHSFREYFPYLALGMFTWNILLGALGEGARALLDNRSMLLQSASPPAMFPIVAVLRQVIVAMHHVPFLAVVVILFAPHLQPQALAALLGLALVLTATVAVALALAVVCAYVPDLSEVILSSLRFVFFFTPVLWMPQARSWAAEYLPYNPFYHFIEIVRAPVLYGQIPYLSFAIAGGLTVLSWVVATFIYRRWAGAAATHL